MRSERTRLAYVSAYRNFTQWAFKQSLSIITEDLLDVALERYLDSLYFQGKGIYTGRIVVYAASFCRQLNTRHARTLHRSKAALVGWKRATPSYSRDPMPFEAAALLAFSMAKRGAQGLAAASALITSFDGYLRPSEVLAVRPIDVHQPNNQRHLAAVTIAPALPDDGSAPVTTKAGEQDDTVVFGDAASRDAKRHFVAALLRRRADAAKNKFAPIFNLLLSDYERLIADALISCRLSGLNLVPHCARHGGASTDFHNRSRTLSEIQKRGRWKARASVLRYEKDGRLVRQLSRMTAAQLVAARKAIKALPRLLL